ncbi:cupin domain-containing protein [Dyella sp.]|jgi:quercetin dioxygenase-like cupin family protein|uniref:cupin domain-containing protein n=1 Tax=Dyella sp. TaxID=1869338 RepID=UPI002D76548F|nr:cupin domain-containing protein [Dyella sp.]HET6432666.1 cupin domain-containing protein [Dyella sp.]
MSKIDLHAVADGLPAAWSSRIVGRAAGANLKVVRMDGAAFPEEVHDFDEALLVMSGRMNLHVAGALVQVNAGEVFIVPAGVPHAVDSGSDGVLVIVDA